MKTKLLVCVLLCLISACSGGKQDDVQDSERNHSEVKPTEKSSEVMDTSSPGASVVQSVQTKTEEPKPKKTPFKSLSPAAMDEQIQAERSSETEETENISDSSTTTLPAEGQDADVHYGLGRSN